MANTNNLMTPEELNARLTPEERRANASKAGKASVEARRERKLIKDRILERMGETDWDEMIDGLIERSKDSVKDFEVLRDTIGEKPKDQLEVTAMDINVVLDDED
jgi:hypothetical protein